MKTSKTLRSVTAQRLASGLPTIRASTAPSESEPVNHFSDAVNAAIQKLLQKSQVTKDDHETKSEPVKLVEKQSSLIEASAVLSNADLEQASVSSIHSDEGHPTALGTITPPLVRKLQDTSSHQTITSQLTTSFFKLPAAPSQLPVAFSQYMELNDRIVAAAAAEMAAKAAAKAAAVAAAKRFAENAARSKVSSDSTFKTAESTPERSFSSAPSSRRTSNNRKAVAPSTGKNMWIQRLFWSFFVYLSIRKGVTPTASQHRPQAIHYSRPQAIGYSRSHAIGYSRGLNSNFTCVIH